MSRPFAELVAAMEKVEVATNPDRLDLITDKMREARDHKYRIKEMEEETQRLKDRYNSIIHVQLPEMMMEINQGSMKLLAEGNYPAFQFTLKSYYKANIPDDPSISSRAFQWLEAHGEADIIKRTVVARLGKESFEKQEKIQELLEEIGVDYETKFGVPWNTLTAWLKERHRQYIAQQSSAIEPDQSIEMPPLELFGAFIGQVTEMKEQ